jgi:hypothetical protein
VQIVKGSASRTFVYGTKYISDATPEVHLPDTHAFAKDVADLTGSRQGDITLRG